MNNFHSDLEYSLELNGSDGFNEFYRQFFKTVKEIKSVTQLELQKQGIDKIVILESGKEILIDEKKRRVDYGDILIEEYSSYSSRTPGWLSKNKHTDYLAYAIIPANRIYFLPFWILRVTLRRNYMKWLDKYGRVFAENNGYKTSNIAIPVNVLMDEITRTMQQEPSGGHNM